MRTPAATAIAAILALSSLPACGGGETSWTCDSTASPGTLTVNAPSYVCDSVNYLSQNDYTFTAAATAPHTVDLLAISGNSNLCRPAATVPPTGGFTCPLNEAPEYQVLVFTAEAGVTYQVSVVGASNASQAASTYGIRVTSP